MRIYVSLLVLTVECIHFSKFISIHDVSIQYESSGK